MYCDKTTPCYICERKGDCLKSLSNLEIESQNAESGLAEIIGMAIILIFCFLLITF